ncbi:MAG: tyrosine-protein kinase family protein [Acidimicrobiales bacterium]
MEPIEYARLIRRRWRILAACALVSAVVVWVLTPASPAKSAPEFVAEHTLIRDGDATASPAALATVALFVRTGEVPPRVAEDIGFTRDPQVLARSVETEVDEQIGTLVVRATAAGRSAASELANAFAEETLAVLGERAQQSQDKVNADLVARVTKRRARIDDLERQSAAARAAGKSSELIDAQRDAELRLYGTDLELQQKQADVPPPAAGFVTLEAATPELARPRSAGLTVPAGRPGRTAAAGLLGLILGAVVALVVERVDPRITLRAGAERAFKLPVVAEVPFSRTRRYDVLTASDPSSAVAEAYRAVRSAILLIPGNVLGRTDDIPAEPAEPVAPTPTVAVPSMLGPVGNGHGAAPTGEMLRAAPGEPQVVLVTSAAPAEGKTATAANLAASFAETGRSVLVLSCDFRRPSIHEHLGVRQAWGLTDVLEGGPDAPKLADVVKDSIIAGVRVATNGSPLDSYGEVAAYGRELVSEARALADIVIIDTAPILVAHEATELIPAADTVLVVCRSGQTSKEDAARTREMLTRLRASVAGVVLVGAPESETGYSTYYYETRSRPARRSFGGWLLGRRPPVPPDDTLADAPPPDRKRAVT